MGFVIETKAKCPQKLDKCEDFERVRGPSASISSMTSKHQVLSHAQKLHICLNFCGHFAFVSITEPTKVDEAFLEPEWIQAMQEELHQFKLKNV